MGTEGSLNVWSNYGSSYQACNSLNIFLKVVFGNSLDLPGMLSRNLIVFLTT